MIKILLIFIINTTFAIHENLKCNKTDDYLINIYDCNSYYRCDKNLIPIKEKCNENITVFSLKDKACVYGKDCEIESIFDGKFCYIENEIYKDYNYRCGYFYKCSKNNSLILLTCHKNNRFTHFDFENLLCSDKLCPNFRCSENYLASQIEFFP